MSQEAHSANKLYQGNAVASVILGALSFFFWISIPLAAVTLAVLALALGIMSLALNQANKIAAVVGIVLGGVGTIIGVIYLATQLFLSAI